MPPRLPSAWTVATLAGLLGLAMGSGTAALATLTRPMRIGDFSPALFRGDAKASDGPRAVVESSEHDFGPMGSGRSGSHRFRIANAGSAPLRLTKGRSSCGCTIAELGREEIAPGETGDVTVEWRTKGEGGPFHQQVMVHTNDPRRPDVSLRITGSVVPTWRAIPPAIVFPTLGTSQRQSATVTLLTYTEPPPSLEKVVVTEPSTADYFSLESRRLSEEEVAARGDPEATGGLLVTLETRPGLPLGPLRQTVRATLRTPPGSGSAKAAATKDGDGEAATNSGAGRKEGKGREAGGATAAPVPPGVPATSAEVETGDIIVEIPVEGTVAGDLAVAGRAWDSNAQAVVLGSVSSRTGLRTEVFLTVKGPHRETVRPRLERVVPSSLLVDIGESKPVGTGTVRRVPITVTIPPGSPTCNHLGTEQAPAGRIVLETGHPDAPLMEIPVRIAIEP